MSKGMSTQCAEELADRVIEAAVQVHKELGAGRAKSVYENALQDSLSSHGLQAYSQVWMPLQLRGLHLNCGAVADVLVEEDLIVKIVNSEAGCSVAEEELLSCLQMSGKKMGLLLDFNEPILSEGIKLLALWEPAQALH